MAKLKKVWFVEHPTYRYKEDVKELALKNGLKIRDSKFVDTVDKKLVVDKPPTLTLKDEYKPKNQEK